MEIYGATSRKWGKDSEHIQFVHQFAKPTSAARLASSRMRAGYFGHEPSLAGAAKGVGCTVGVLSIVAQWRDDVPESVDYPCPRDRRSDLGLRLASGRTAQSGDVEIRYGSAAELAKDPVPTLARCEGFGAHYDLTMSDSSTLGYRTKR